MTLKLDPIFEESHPTGSPITVPSVLSGDAIGLRANLDPLLVDAFRGSDPAPDVKHRPATTRRGDGKPIPMRWYKKDNSAPGSAVIFLHGGGMIAGSVEIYDPFVRQHVQWSGVPMLSVDYTLAPGTGDEAPAYEALAAIQWVLDHAATLQIDPERVAIMGDSAGGGIAAATAILARDRGINIAQQILVFPMLDDRTLEMDPQVARFATWTHEDNYTGWRALLGDRLGSPHVSAYFAPSRLEDFAGLAPAYIEVGTLDLFRDECISYAQRLLRAGVQTELHVHPGAPHGYDSLALGSSFAARWKADRVRVIRNL